MKINEENFVIHLKKRDEKALDYIIDNYSWIIKTVVTKHLNNLIQYKDECINDVFLAIWNNSDKFDEEKGEFKNWIAAISKFKAIDYKRKYLKEAQHENIDDLNLSIKNPIDENMMNEEIQQDIKEILNCLSKQDKELFYKLYIEEKEIVEITNETGVKRDVIYNRLSRGRKKLRNIFRLKENRGVRYYE